MEISQEYSDCDDQMAAVVKGKRSKRPRGLSPGENSSYSSGGGDGGGGEVYCSSSTAHSPTTSTSQISTANIEEDEDVANCLILLARGHRDNELLSHPDQQKVLVGAVYQCKTCDKNFSSFQALGGHRASHKKPKTSVEQNLVTLLQKSAPEDRLSEKSTTSMTWMLGNRDDHADRKPGPRDLAVSGGGKGSNNDNKIHECSVCGSEFSSGQALGGHMRRHRPPLSNNNVVTLSSSSDGREKPMTMKDVFTLDLNLPAPHDEGDQDDDVRGALLENNNIGFSTPALVGCHY